MIGQIQQTLYPWICGFYFLLQRKLVDLFSACTVLQPLCVECLIFLPSESFKRSYSHDISTHGCFKTAVASVSSLVQQHWSPSQDLVDNTWSFSCWTLNSACNLAGHWHNWSHNYLKEHINGLLRGGKCLKVMWVARHIVAASQESTFEE